VNEEALPHWGIFCEKKENETNNTILTTNIWWWGQSNVNFIKCKLEV
jgi:hypothetical protein